MPTPLASDARGDTLSREHQGPRAIWNAIERLTGSYRRECVEAREDLEIAEAQLRDYRQRDGQPFGADEYFAQLAKLRDRLKVALASRSTDPDHGKTTAELAEQITALRVVNSSVEAAPARMTRKETAAAEPVTLRIRRTALANPEDASAEQQVEPAVDAPPLPAGKAPSIGNERLSNVGTKTQSTPHCDREAERRVHLHDQAMER